MNHALLSEVFTFLIASCIVVPLARKFKLSAVIGYLLVGVVIGPMFLNLTNNSEGAMHLAELGIIMMLFIIGLELEPANLWQLRKAIIGIGGLQVTITTICFAFIGIIFGLKYQSSLAIALALSLSSTALVLNLLQEKNLLNSKIGETSFAVLLFQDIAVIPILILLPFLAENGFEKISSGKTLISDMSSLNQIIIVLAVILILIFVGKFLSRHFFRLIAKSNLRELFTALSLALILGITLLAQQIGISPALGAFIAGVVLANSEYRKNLETDISPFKGLLLGLFFISVGMKMDLTLLQVAPLKILGIVVGLMLFKTLIMWALGRVFKISNCDSLGYAMTLCQGSEFAFVLFQFSEKLQLIDNKTSGFLALIVTLSMAFTPFLISIFNKIVQKYFSSPNKNNLEFDNIEKKRPIILAGFGRFGQIVGRFLISQGFEITVLEKDPDQIDLLRSFGFKAYYGDATQSDFLRSAHANQSEALIIAVDNIQNSLEIARIAKKDFPNLKIFARAHNRQHAYDLNRIGVNYFKRETFDSSLALGVEVASLLGKDKSEMKIKAEKFRNHDEETLQESFKFFEDKPALINFSKTRRAELERILQSDSVTK
ncbi:MAG: monovalent cation:proton antiporter-2 (CPA2) family protein [Rickettsiales bacterium]|nr:monovalent cation:proton antiporter-2 (CPA2) family protein [Rickettsiales bacterium]